MTNFREINFSEAMEMVANDDLDNLYFRNDIHISCVADYKIDVSELKTKTYFKKEYVE